LLQKVGLSGAKWINVMDRAGLISTIE